MHDSLRWTVDQALHLRDAGALRGASWTLAMVCEHLALTVARTVDSPAGLRLKPGGAGGAGPVWWSQLGTLQRLKRRVMKHALLLTGWFPKGVPAPAIVAPSDTADLDTAIDSMRAAVAAFEAKLAAPESHWVDHPLFGPMTGKQWRRFHTLHARHHFGFMTRAD